MRIGLRILLAAGLGLATLQSPARAADEKAGTPKPPASFKDEREKASYSLGLNVGKYIKSNHLDMDVDMIAQTIRDVVAGQEPKMTDQQAMEAMRNYQHEASVKTSEKNKSAGEAFFAEN